MCIWEEIGSGSFWSTILDPSWELLLTLTLPLILNQLKKSADYISFILNISNNHFAFPELIIASFDTTYTRNIGIKKNNCTGIKVKTYEIKYFEPLQSFAFLSRLFANFCQVGNINYLTKYL